MYGPPHFRGHARHTVLIVDDDRSTRELFRTTLRLAGFDVRTAVDGVSALWQIGRQRLDVVGLDLDLPGGVNGIVIHQELESREQTRHVPFDIVTGTAWQSPVPAYATPLKPISPDDLVNTVRQAALSQRLGA